MLFPGDRAVFLFRDMQVQQVRGCGAFAAGETGDFQLRREDYNISGNIFHGMTGYVDYRFPKDPEQSRLLKTVFAYATYCGVGGKTGMGMGGFVLA